MLGPADLVLGGRQAVAPAAFRHAVDQCLALPDRPLGDRRILGVKAETCRTISPVLMSIAAVTDERQ